MTAKRDGCHATEAFLMAVSIVAVMLLVGATVWFVVGAYR